MVHGRIPPAVPFAPSDGLERPSYAEYNGTRFRLDLHRWFSGITYEHPVPR